MKQAVLEVHNKPPHSAADMHPGRLMHGAAAELLGVLGEVEFLTLWVDDRPLSAGWGWVGSRVWAAREK